MVISDVFSHQNLDSDPMCSSRKWIIDDRLSIDTNIYPPNCFPSKHLLKEFLRNLGHCSSNRLIQHLNSNRRFFLRCFLSLPGIVVVKREDISWIKNHRRGMNRCYWLTHPVLSVHPSSLVLIPDLYTSSIWCFHLNFLTSHGWGYWAQYSEWEIWPHLIRFKSLGLRNNWSIFV